MLRHPTPENLLALSEGRLETDEAEKVERHLEGCETCRRNVEVVRSGIEALAQLPPARLDEPRAHRIRDRLGSEAAVLRQARRRRWAAWAAVAALVLTVSAAALFRLASHSPLFVRCEKPLGGLEESALQLHRQRLSAPAAGDENPAPTKRGPSFVASRTFSLSAGRALQTDWVVDGRPVTLLLTDYDTSDPPTAPLPKQVRYRSLPDGLISFTWRQGSQIYNLISAATGDLSACSICHHQADLKPLAWKLQL